MLRQVGQFYSAVYTAGIFLDIVDAGTRKDTTAMKEEANVKGRNVTLNVAGAQASIGKISNDPFVFDAGVRLNSLSDQEFDQLRRTLADSERVDTKLSSLYRSSGGKKGTVEFKMYNDFDIETLPGGSLKIISDADAYIGGEGEITVDTINVGGNDLRIKTNGNIFAKGGNGREFDLRAESMILEGAHSQIGTLADPMRLNFTSSGAPSIIARASKGVYLDAGQQTVQAAEVYGDQLWFRAGTFANAEDKYVADSKHARIAGHDITLISTVGGIGADDNPLLVKQLLEDDQFGSFNIDSAGGVYLESLSSGFSFDKVASDFAFKVKSTEDIFFKDTMDDNDDATYSELEAIADGEIFIAQNLALASDVGMLFDAQNINVEGALNAGTEMSLVANQLLSVGGSLKSGDAMSLTSTQGNVEMLAGSTADSDGKMTISAAEQADIDGDLTSVAAMKVSAKNIDISGDLESGSTMSLSAEQLLSVSSSLESGDAMTLLAKDIELVKSSDITSMDTFTSSAGNFTKMAGRVFADDDITVNSYDAWVTESGWLYTNESVIFNVENWLNMCGNISAKNTIALDMRNILMTETASLISREGDILLTASEDARIAGYLNANQLLSIQAGWDIDADMTAVAGQMDFEAGGFAWLNGNYTSRGKIDALSGKELAIGAKALSGDDFSLSSTNSDILIEGDLTSETRMYLEARDGFITSTPQAKILVKNKLFGWAYDGMSLFGDIEVRKLASFWSVTDNFKIDTTAAWLGKVIYNWHPYTLPGSDQSNFNGGQNVVVPLPQTQAPVLVAVDFGAASNNGTYAQAIDRTLAIPVIHFEKGSFDGLLADLGIESLKLRDPAADIESFTRELAAADSALAGFSQAHILALEQMFNQLVPLDEPFTDITASSINMALSQDQGQFALAGQLIDDVVQYVLLLSQIDSDLTSEQLFSYVLDRYEIDVTENEENLTAYFQALVGSSQDEIH